MEEACQPVGGEIHHRFAGKILGRKKYLERAKPSSSGFERASVSRSFRETSSTSMAVITHPYASLLLRSIRTVFTSREFTNGFALQSESAKHAGGGFGWISIRLSSLTTHGMSRSKYGLVEQIHTRPETRVGSVHVIDSACEQFRCHRCTDGEKEKKTCTCCINQTPGVDFVTIRG